LKIPESLRGRIANAPLTHLTTIDSKGWPQVTVVWVGIEDDEFIIGHRVSARGLKKSGVMREWRLSLLRDKTNALGLREYLVI
jgi:hypothetical protein